LAQAGDITTDAIVSVDRAAQATILARQAGCIAGLPFACRTFFLLDGSVTVQSLVSDGASVVAGQPLATLCGPARALLTAERVALNLLGHLSGIATATAAFVAAVEGTGVRIRCTRKTTPGLRALEKYAVRAGGGFNHRFGLYDAVLIKDNHLAVAGGVREAVTSVRGQVPPHVRIELEVETLDQIEEALEEGVDTLLLDNMDIPTLQRSVKLVAGRATLEASGGITLENARAFAETGVDFLSVGWMTHSAPALDVALDFAS
jgi:nicotinate-nucleotide pyrophosphorylase (carboxylating)